MPIDSEDDVSPVASSPTDDSPTAPSADGGAETGEDDSANLAEVAESLDVTEELRTIVDDTRQAMLRRLKGPERGAAKDSLGAASSATSPSRRAASAS